MTYRIIVSPAALQMLRGIRDERIRRQIYRRIDGLSVDPERQGKALVGELSGFRAIRAAGQRYRVIYRVVKDEVQVTVVAVGRRNAGNRRDIYELAQRLVRLRLVDPEE